MRVAVEKVEGVEEAAVSLNDGEVVITLRAGNHVTVEQLRGVVRDQGFTPREASIRVRGRIERRGEGWVLTVPGSGATLRLSGSTDALQGLAAVTNFVVLRGEMAEERSRALRVTSAERARPR